MLNTANTLLLISFLCIRPLVYGSMSSIAVSYGENPVVCAIQASQEQEILCWAKNTTVQFPSIPPLYALSGGSGFICGLQSGNNKAFCFLTRSNSSFISSIVPEENAYQSISAGDTHICAAISSSVECWGVRNSSSSVLHPPDLKNVAQLASGSGFTCALDDQGGVSCWGDDSSGAISKAPAGALFESISAGGEHVCGIEKTTKRARCWGRQLGSPPGIQFAILAAGSAHTCGIRTDNHEIECWGMYGMSGIPTRTAFLAVASGGGISCGIREGNLLAECWGGMLPEYAPPPELFTPGICSSASSCAPGFFEFNASNHGVPEVDGVCSRSQRICSPCATACPTGTFFANSCTENEDIVCVECPLCTTPECEHFCVRNPGERFEKSGKRKSMLILIGVSCGFVSLVALIALMRIRRMLVRTGKNKPPQVQQLTEISNGNKDLVVHSGVQLFKLSDLRDATNGFKEMNEIGRGRYGIVYKAVLPDGTHLAVKRASAARRIQFTNKEFESELETLCRVRHENLVNLVGYCDQMGERLMAYEYMSNGSLYHHLHGDDKAHSCPIATKWAVRVAVATQAAKGIEFLHESKPPVIHGDINSSNVMLDREWKARISDFGLLGRENASFASGYGRPQHLRRRSGGRSNGRNSNTPEDQSNGANSNQEENLPANERDDVYAFGVVLLEILTGRKAVIGGVFDPPVRLVDWALPMIERGKFDTLIDPNCSADSFAHSSSKQSLVRYIEIAEACVSDRSPSMAEVCSRLQDLSAHVKQHHSHHYYHQPISCIKLPETTY